jgi:uncharacterized membrane protein YbhN (UPF0104 family)
MTLTPVPEAVAEPGRREHRWAGPIRLVLGCAAPIILAVLVVWHWPTVRAGTTAMGGASRTWLLTALAAVGLTWLAGTCCQLGATTRSIPFGRVFFTQVAGSFANHVLPAGFGVATLNLRMLRRAGLSMPGAAGAVGLNAAAGFAVHALALGALLLIAGPRVDHVGASRLIALSSGATVLILLAAVLVRQMLRRGGRYAEHVRTILAASRDVMHNPVRSAMLRVGSAAVPALHILTLTAVVRGLHHPVPILTIAVVYLGASAVSAAIPGPGGFGALDVTLVATLTGIGMSASMAAATVIGYRLVTVWLPLLPGAVTLIFLLHRRIV